MDTKTEIYRDVSANIAAQIDSELDVVAKMATISCELFLGFENFHWVGFYRNIGDETLKIGPYQGTHGCLNIPFSRGVCGACATMGETQIIADVEAIKNHIACSSTTRSEIVLPVYNSSKLIGVLDIDSNNIGEFDKIDQAALEAILSSSF